MKRKLMISMVIATCTICLCACGKENKKNEKATNETTTEAHIHEYNSTVTKDATCTEEGENTFTCACNDTYTEVIAATGHTYGEYAYNNDATLDNDGTMTATCANCGAKDTKTAEGSKLSYTYTDLNATMYASSSVNVRKYPTSDSEKIGSLGKGVEVKVTGQCKENGWFRISYDGGEAFVSKDYLTNEKPYVAEALPAKYKGIEKDGPYKVVNGIAITLDDESEYAAYNERSIKMCEAGYNVPIYFEKFNAWFMLYECPYSSDDERFDKTMIAADNKLIAYIESLGYSQDDVFFNVSGGAINNYGDRYVQINLWD